MNSGAGPGELLGRAIRAGLWDGTLLVVSWRGKGMLWAGCAHLPGGEARGQGQSGEACQAGAWRESRSPRGTSVSLLGR